VVAALPEKGIESVFFLPYRACIIPDTDGGEFRHEPESEPVSRVGELGTDGVRTAPG